MIILFGGGTAAHGGGGGKFVWDVKGPHTKVGEGTLCAAEVYLMDCTKIRRDHRHEGCLGS